jgi:hypothetical protein
MSAPPSQIPDTAGTVAERHGTGEFTGCGEEDSRGAVERVYGSAADQSAEPSESAQAQSPCGADMISQPRAYGGEVVVSGAQRAGALDKARFVIAAAAEQLYKGSVRDLAAAGGSGAAGVGAVAGMPRGLPSALRCTTLVQWQPAPRGLTLGGPAGAAGRGRDGVRFAGEVEVVEDGGDADGSPHGDGGAGGAREERGWPERNMEIG